MKVILFSALFLSITALEPGALQCYDCVHFEVEDKLGLTQTFVGEGLGNQDCKVSTIILLSEN